MRARLESLLRHRLFHFAVLGLVLWTLGPKATAREASVVVEAARVDVALRAEQARRGRVLTDPEKQAVMHALVDEDLLAKEGLRRGVGERDEVVRSRVAASMRTLFEATIPPSPVAERDVQAEVDRLLSTRPGRVRLGVAFVSKDRPDAAHRADLLARDPRGLGEAGSVLGDRPPIPDDALWSESDLARVAGDVVAKVAMETELGKRSRAVASAWGFFVWEVRERRPAAATELRAEALATLQAKMRERELGRLLDSAARSYVVDVRVPAGEPAFEPARRAAAPEVD